MKLLSLLLVSLIPTTAFPQTPPSFQVLYNFDLVAPAGAPVIGPSGAAFGVTTNGGSADEGTIFVLTPPASGSGLWDETVLYEFSGIADGANPLGVVLGPNGVLYGVTLNGGANYAGVVFQLVPPSTPSGPWVESVIHAFGGAGDGAKPSANVILGQSGELIGPTYDGPNGGGGVVFALYRPTASNPTWSEKVLYQFEGQASSRTALRLEGNGALVGTIAGHENPFVPTSVFTLRQTGGARTWMLTTLYTFPDNEQSRTPLVQAGYSFFGATVYGGSADLGTVFQVAVPLEGQPTEHPLESFSGPVWGPSGNLVIAGRTIFGAAGSGSTREPGGVFALTAPTSGGNWTYTSLHTFSPPRDGANPLGGLARGSNGVLFGFTTYGGSGGGGTFYQVVPPSFE